MAMPLSARGPQRDVARASGNHAGGSMTPREGSSLKMAGLDLTSLKPDKPATPSNEVALPPGVKRRGVDTVPRIPYGGKKGEVHPWSCEPTLVLPSPPTPENRADVLKRHKRRTGPGEITVHWGMQTVTKPDPGIGYGTKSKKCESVMDNFRQNQHYGIEEYIHSRGESIYHSVKHEPLGCSFKRNFHMPEATTKKEFKGFGKEFAKDEVGAKDCIFPRGVQVETEEDLARYKKTHASFDPGERMSRMYEWPDKVTKNENFRFGVIDQLGSLQSGKGAKTVLTMDMEVDMTKPKTRVGKLCAENYREVSGDHLGRGRNLLQGVPPLPAGHAFGMRSGADNAHAGELVAGFYAPEDQLPDPDLGKCVLQGRRNFQTKRPFGVPTVRRDLDAPSIGKRSIASSTNYGDDHDCFGLLYPQKFVHRGIADGDFSIRRSPEEVRALAADAGYRLQDDQFLTIWDACVRHFGDTSNLVSLEVFLGILADWMSQNGGVAALASARSIQKTPDLSPAELQQLETMLPQDLAQEQMCSSLIEGMGDMMPDLSSQPVA